MSKEIRIKIDGSASGNNRTVIASDLQILGRVYDTVTGAYETEWAPLPARELDMHIEPMSAVEATVTLRVSEIENLRLAVPESEITVDQPELDLEIGGPVPRRTLPEGVYNVYVGSYRWFQDFLSTNPGEVRRDWVHATSSRDVEGLRGIARLVSSAAVEHSLLDYITARREELARRAGIPAASVEEWTR
ncbi:hypothetical protein SEA_REYNAULD_7 [Rhodococcus phage Reynauld]|uniref:Uncharacterized protein n=1 Tax=Rhodococcus phage Reynauld TaxID=3062845 RepID=A0ACD4UHA2_9CAUD|nr:hypothetical protein SEA_REYNAULD_7 [Rhodococcus phage Reynauld]